MQPLTVTRTIQIAAAPERVFHAVTDPAQLVHWFAPGCPWEIPTLQTGAGVKFYNAPTDIQYATIAVLDPPREFALRWQPAPDQPAVALLTTFRLEPSQGGTRLTLTEAGYETYPAALRQSLLEQTEAGYAVSLDALKAHLERIAA